MRMEMCPIVYSQGRPMAGKSEESVALNCWTIAGLYAANRAFQRKAALNLTAVVPHRSRAADKPTTTNIQRLHVEHRRSCVFAR
jgi:hypothetical protein